MHGLIVLPGCEGLAAHHHAALQLGAVGHVGIAESAARDVAPVFEKNHLVDLHRDSIEPLFYGGVDALVARAATRSCKPPVGPE